MFENSREGAKQEEGPGQMGKLHPLFAELRIIWFSLLMPGRTVSLLSAILATEHQAFHTQSQLLSRLGSLQATGKSRLACPIGGAPDGQYEYGVQPQWTMHLTSYGPPARPRCQSTTVSHAAFIACKQAAASGIRRAWFLGQRASSATGG